MLHGSTSTVEDGEVVVILGANGAGKTTTLRAVSGMVDTTGSRARSTASSVVGKATERSSGRASAHVPQGRGTFPELTVRGQPRRSAPTCARDREVVRADIERWFDDVSPARRAARAAGGQPDRRRAADARGRPGADVAARSCCSSTSRRSAWRRSSSQELFQQFAELNQREGTTMLIVEQNANLALAIARPGLRARGRPDRARRNERRAPRRRRRPQGLPGVLTMTTLRSSSTAASSTGRSSPSCSSTA